MKIQVLVLAGALLVGCGEQPQGSFSRPHAVASKYDQFQERLERAKDELKNCRDDANVRTTILGSIIVYAAQANISAASAIAMLMNGLRDQLAKDYCDQIFKEAVAEIDRQRAAGVKVDGGGN